MAYKHIFYPESMFGGFTDIDGTIAFYNRVNSLINKSFTILDFGCGRGAHIDDSVTLRKNLHIFKGKVEKVIGIDIDRLAENNPFLDEFYFIDSKQWPLNENTIDLCICDSVLEHVENPDYFFLEANRVLKDGGYLCIRTPNSWSYISFISKLIPYKYHHHVLKKAQNSRKEKDVFPTYYRCNNIRKLKKFLNKYNFDNMVYGYEAEPSYLSFSKVAYWFGVLHQRFSPKFFRPVIFAYGKLKK